MGLAEFTEPCSGNVLADTPGYRITFHSGGSSARVLLVTFGTMLSGLENKGFGTQYASKKGYDHIYVAQAPDSWYQQLSRQQFSNAVSDLAAKYERVFAYGSSLGGYAALYFGGVIGAQVVAGSPINWAHPLMSSKEWQHVDFVHEPLLSLPHQPRPPIVLYDPMRASDRLFVETLVSPAFGGSRIIRLPFSGHAVFVSMRENGYLDSFLRNVFEEDVVIDLPLEKEGSYIYHLNRAEYFLDQSKILVAESQFRESLKCKFNRIAAGRLARLLSSQKRFSELDELCDEGFIALGNTLFMKGIKRE